jgi:hypothetical protein
LRYLILLPSLLLGLLLICLPARAAELVLTLRAPETAADQRQVYHNAVLRLALDKTRASHGPYRLRQSPPMNKQRALLSAQQRAYPNFLLVSGPEVVRAQRDLVPVRFPIYLGATGYRVCFVAPAAREAVAGSQSLEALRRFRHVQGVGWADGAILRANGFEVQEVPSYDAMFRMVARGRTDLFCRSVLELSGELRAYAELDGLTLDRSFALLYELPQFFYTHGDNRELVERLTLGLRQAHADGSLLALFRTHLLPGLRQAELGRRRLFRLQTAPLPELGFDYRQYELDMLREPQ